MKTKLLVAGLTCLSVVAVAQQSAGTEKSSSKGTSTGTAQTTASSAGAGSKLSGKKGYDYRGNKTSQDHWDAKVAAGNNTNQNGSASGNAGQATMVRESPSKASLSTVRESPSKASTSVSTGDVNGDGRADEVATGKTTGKRQHQPVTVTKSVDKASPK
jgi:FG-GAP repeat